MEFRIESRSIALFGLAIFATLLAGCSNFSTTTTASIAPVTTPDVVLSVPTDGTLVSGASTLVSGTCTTDAGSVTISGTAIQADVVTTCTSDLFSSTVTLVASEGTRTITTSQSTAAGTTTKTISVTRNCALNFVLIPADGVLGTPAVCIAKYEMKAKTNAGVAVFDGNNGGVPLDETLHIPESRPDGIPWVRITQPNAILECATMGAGYHLVTAKEWSAMIRNVAARGTNWDSGTAGTGKMFSGHSDGVLSATAVADGFGAAGTSLLSAGTGTDAYVGTGNASTDLFGSGKEQRRTFDLSNGEKIWDISGNARDTNDADGLGNTLSYTGPGSSGLNDVFSAAVTAFLPTIALSGGGTFDANWIQPATAGLDNATNAIGRFYLSSGARAGRILTRGGNFSPGNSPGVFAADFDSDTASQSSTGAFRCAKNF
ncbi:hypothetical protein BH10BDE1_BH10BDE1_17730 [soil metagenome]